MQARVQLPPGPLIEYWSFCRAIAQAVCPAGEHGLEGIDCIVGKLAKPKMLSTFSSGDGRIVDRIIPSQAFLNWARVSSDGPPLDAESGARAPKAPSPDAEVWFPPSKLDENDRNVLEAMLRDLPPLRYPISEGEAAAFMEAYRDLPEGPSWDPILVKAEDIEQRKRGQARAFERHQRALQKWFSDGRLEAVDTHHAPVPALMTGTFIPRHQAVAYLERCGLEHSDMRSSKGGSDAVSHEDSQSEPSTHKRAVGVPKYSESKQKQIVDECRRLQEKKEPGFAKKIAKKYGYSEKQLYNLRKKFEQEGRELQSASRRVVRP